MFKEFKEFAMRGNVVDMAVGIVIGAAFGAIVASFVGDVLMPIIGTLLGGVDFSNYFIVLKNGVTAPGPYPTLAAVKAAGGVAVGYGVLIKTIVNFLIGAFALFMVIKAMNAAKKREEAAPAVPPPSAEQKLLTEIRDLLARR